MTFGRVPKNGVVPLGYTLDSVGPMARSAYDCALLLDIMAGYDPGDPYASQQPVATYSAALDGDVTGLRIGLPEAYFLDGDITEEVRVAVRDIAARLTAAGATVVDITIPYAHEAHIASNVTWVGEGFAYHRNDLVNRWSDYGASTRDVLGRGAFFSGADYNQAQRVRTMFRREVAKVFEQVDVILTPTTGGGAPIAAEMTMGALFTAAGFTGQWNLLGLPAVALPCGFDPAGLPLSAQIVSKPFDEASVLKVADACQRVTDWHLQVVPPIAAEIAA